MTRSTMLLSFFILLSLGRSLKSGGGIRGKRSMNVGNALVLGPLQLQDNIEIDDHEVSSTRTLIASYHHIHTCVSTYDST
jgi:hypothetical protein